MADVAERPSALPELCRSHAGVRLEKLGESGLIGEVETIDDLLVFIENGTQNLGPADVKTDIILSFHAYSPSFYEDDIIDYTKFCGGYLLLLGRNRRTNIIVWDLKYTDFLVQSR